MLELGGFGRLMGHAFYKKKKKKRIFPTFRDNEGAQHEHQAKGARE